MYDLISRKYAIEALLSERKELDSYMEYCLMNGLYELRSLAKAQRNRIDEDIEILTGLPTQSNIPNALD